MPTWRENLHNAMSPDGILAEGSELPANNQNWEDYFRAACTPSGIKIAGVSGGAAVIIKGHFDTAEELPETAEVGDAYTVGTTKPYDVYIYDENGEWQNIGPIQGPKGDKGSKGDKGEKGDPGSVESVNGKTGAVVLSASDINAQNSQTIQANLERIDETAEQTIDDLAVVEAIAKGAQQAIVYGDYETFVTAFNALDGTEYNAGQNAMIVTLEVPDLWISSVEETSVPYTYTTDEAFIADMEADGYVQVGYYKVSQLETGKVDLTDYVRNTDYATVADGGVVKINPYYKVRLADNGQLYADIDTYSQYGSTDINSFISKGTLDNVIAGKQLKPNVVLTKAEYDALTTHEPNTIYLVRGE